MEIALTVITALGIFLFVIAYLKFVVTGFKHHFVTGIISIFPVANILVLPSLWHRSGRFLIVGIVGLLLATGAWFMGAEKGMQKYLGLLLGKDDKPLIAQAPANGSSIALPVPAVNTGSEIQSPSLKIQPTQTAIKSTTVDESALKKLPNKALYKMSFEEVPIKNIATLKGRIVRMTDNNLASFEGRITNISPSSVFIELTGNNVADLELPIANIKKLSLMVRKPL